MPSFDPMTPERAAIDQALVRIEHRLRLNQALRAASLIAGMIVLALIAWRALRWLGASAPAAGALVILLVILGGIALLSLLVLALLAGTGGATRAASEADLRGRLRDELKSAWWFLQGEARSEWIAAQVQRAAHTAAGLRPAQLIPLRVPGPALGALMAGLVVLVAVWLAPPLGPGGALADNALLTPAEAEQVRALRALAEALPQSAAARRLEAALATLQSAAASPAERRHALAQAQAAVEQMRMEAASSRESLQRLSETLRGQPGMEAVADALARGDAKQAAQLLAELQQQTAQTSGVPVASAEPAEGSGQKGIEQLLQKATDASGATDQSGGADLAKQEAVDRLKEIARELEASAAVNEAWQRVRGSQLNVGESRGLSASRFAQQTSSPSMPSPGTGETPMEGGTLFRTAAVAEGDGRTEQEGGTRAGDALGDARSDPLLGSSAERLEAQLKRQALTGEEQPSPQQDENRPWYYEQSRQQKALAGLRSVHARERFAAAQAGAGEGISIQHRQIVKDYFMKPSSNAGEAAR